ncbi:sensor histidine kinase [Ahniella affigens]|nr:histidine kinase [Ahniella affigens]
MIHTPSRWALGAVWAMIAVLIAVMMMQTHGSGWHDAFAVAFRLVLLAAILGWVASRFCRRFPWPHPFRSRFLLLHGAASLVYAGLFVLLNLSALSLIHHKLVLTLGPSLASNFALGALLYLIVAAASYAEHASSRVAALEVQAARAQLAALRGQLHPHFLFNALHTVVQLIETDSKAAVRAAEGLAEVLREAVDEARMLRPLRVELAFVKRYLSLESLRFGPRLEFAVDCPDAVAEALVPSFAIQTLIENAVRHGAAPSMTVTRICLLIESDSSSLRISVQDDGVGWDEARPATPGGLQRLRDQLRVLYGSAASVAVTSQVGQGYRVQLTVPLQTDAESL